MNVKPVVIVCNHCGWVHDVTFDDDRPLPAVLKRAWGLGLDHAWENKGHVVETFVDGRLKATQQVAEMSAWKDHNAVIRAPNGAFMPNDSENPEV